MIMHRSCKPYYEQIKTPKILLRKITDCEGLTQYHPSPFIISCKKKEKKTIY